MRNSEREDNFQQIERRQIENEADLQSVSAKKLYQWWAGYGPEMPTRDDFDISKIPSIASDIYLIEVLGVGNYMYRLCGEEVGRLVGRTYRMIEISVTDDDLADALFSQYLDWAVETGGAVGCVGDLSFFDKKFLRFESVDCPLVGDNGKITHIVGVLCKTPQD